MKLLDLELHNFRRYEAAKFHFHPKFTVLIGDNGKGKTTILDAIAVMLGTYFQSSGIKTGQSVIRKTDARLLIVEKKGQVFWEPQQDVYLSAQAMFRDHQISWRRDIKDRGRKARMFVDMGSEDRELISKGESVDLPLLLYYGSGRLWDTHRDVPTEPPGSQLDAYRFCLDPKSDHKAFEKWFKRLSYAELQKKQSISALTAVREAVLTCIPGSQEFYYDTMENQIIIRLEQDGMIPFNYLSDGYRNMVAMAADIAYRAARLNPHMGEGAATQTQGIVLIDEIDLHLHPKWQRRVVGDLQQAFPALQFIATTHSPFILQSLEPGEVVDLDQSPMTDNTTRVPEDIAFPCPANSYSHRSLEDIAEDVMGIEIPQRSLRYQQMYEAAKQYYSVLQQAKEASSEEKEKLKRQLDVLSSPFSDNVAYHAFLEMERLSSGLNHSE